MVNTKLHSHSMHPNSQCLRRRSIEQFPCVPILRCTQHNVSGAGRGGDLDFSCSDKHSGRPLNIREGEWMDIFLFIVMSTLAFVISLDFHPLLFGLTKHFDKMLSAKSEMGHLKLDNKLIIAVATFAS